MVFCLRTKVRHTYIYLQRFVQDNYLVVPMSMLQGSLHLKEARKRRFLSWTVRPMATLTYRISQLEIPDLEFAGDFGFDGSATVVGDVSDAVASTRREITAYGPNFDGPAWRLANIPSATRLVWRLGFLTTQGSSNTARRQ